MKIALISTLILLIKDSFQQPACYVSCNKSGCLSTNSLACTSCDQGTILINQRCAVTGFQSVMTYLFSNLYAILFLIHKIVWILVFCLLNQEDSKYDVVLPLLVNQAL